MQRAEGIAVAQWVCMCSIMHGSQASKRHVKGAGRRRSSTAAATRTGLLPYTTSMSITKVTVTFLIVVVKIRV